MVAARDSSFVRLNDHEVDEAVPGGKLEMEPGELEKLIRILAARGLVEPVERIVVWKFKGKLLTKGLLGFEKRGEYVSKFDSMIRQTLIINVVP